MLAGRLDRKVEFGLPDLEGRTHILRIHAKVSDCERHGLLCVCMCVWGYYNAMTGQVAVSSLISVCMYGR